MLGGVRAQSVLTYINPPEGTRALQRYMILENRNIEGRTYVHECITRVI
jgi:hypothetical protein